MKEHSIQTEFNSSDVKAVEIAKDAGASPEDLRAVVAEFTVALHGVIASEFPDAEVIITDVCGLASWCRPSSYDGVEDHPNVSSLNLIINRAMKGKSFYEG